MRNENINPFIYIFRDKVADTNDIEVQNVNEEKPKSHKTSPRVILKDFTANSSLHGLKYTSEHLSLIER